MTVPPPQTACCIQCIPWNEPLYPVQEAWLRRDTEARHWEVVGSADFCSSYNTRIGYYLSIHTGLPTIFWSPSHNSVHGFTDSSETRKIYSDNYIIPHMGSLYTVGMH